jgi:tryptophan synthase alpha chain
VSRISRHVREARAARRSALIPFVTAGDPPAPDRAVMHALVEGGADVIELGMPFSDPMADGPVIQRSRSARSSTASAADVLAMVAEFRRTDDDDAVVLMGYANPIERMGLAMFVEARKPRASTAC